MRPLELSCSALSNAEFGLYITSLHSIVRDAGDDMEEYSDGEGGFYEDDMVISLRGIRDWLRENYDHVPITAINQILRMFFSTLQTNRDVSASTFFALHRLIVHVENGESVRRSLVFDQATPSRPGPGSAKRTKRAPSQMENKKKRKLRSNSARDQEEYEPSDEDNSEDHRPRKRVRKQQTPKSIALAQDAPLRCQQCIDAKADCIINPAHIDKLLKWKAIPGWKVRPKGTSCNRCRRQRNSCRPPGMATRSMNSNPSQTVARGLGGMLMGALKSLWKR
ncbi:hypothetical protein BJ912DRAFT_1008161 [Pholiota molesta]|nr:hypothetical protein BJ912DRAFT_1008161 [Pholiota molesta]